MKYTFSNVNGFRLNSSLAAVKREIVSSAREIVPNITREDGTTSPGWLFLLRCQTGIGKTYASAAFILDELINVAKHAYIPNMNDAIVSAADFLEWASGITGFGKTQRSPAIAASITLKKLKDGKFWNNESSSYLSFMDYLVTRCGEVNNLIVESAADEGIKTHSDKMFSRLVAISERKIERKPIVAITDTGDNIKGFHDELLKHIDNDKRLDEFQRSFLNSQVMFLKANRDQIGDVFESTVKPVIDNHFSDSEILKACLDECKRRHKLKGDDPVTKADFGKACDEVNRELVGVYRQYVKKCEQDEKVVDKELETKITKVFPATRFVNGDVTVLFMTTAKYLNAITHSRGRFNFQNDYKEHLLFIDESDKQESVIAKTIIEGRSYKIVDGFRAAHEAATSYKLSNTQRYEGVEEIMKPAFEKVIEVACGNFPPDHSWNVSKALSSQDPVQAFSSMGSLPAMVFNGMLRSRKEEYDDSDIEWVTAKPASTCHAVHMITAGNKDSDSSDSDGGGFPKVINEMSFAYAQFLGSLKRAAYKILKNVTEIDAKRASLGGAIKSLIKYYGIKSISSDVYDYITKTSSLRINLDSTPVVDTGFHTSGFNYTRVTREDASEDSVEFQQYKLPISATGVLMGIVTGGAEVIGISATANAKTALHNFDYDGMKRQLGKRFVEMNPEQAHRVHEEYCQKRNYAGHGVKINISFTKSWEKTLVDVFDGDYGAMLSAVEATFDEVPDSSSIDRRVGQLSRVLQAMREFTEQEGTRYMLCLCSRGIGGNDQEEKLIKKALVKFAGEGEKPELFVKMNADAMRAGEFDEALGVLSGSATRKVTILSSFQSFGAGKNPQYIPGVKADVDSLIKVDDTRPKIDEKKVDIDSLYVDLPTFMFPCGDSNNRLMDTNTRLTLFYNLMCLKEAGVIDGKKAKQFVLNAMEGKQRDRTVAQFVGAYTSKISNHSTFENSRDYCSAVIKYIEQAVGRMARSSFKRKFINIYADHGLIDIISRDNRSHDLLSHEYIALMKEAKKVATEECIDSVLAVTSELDDMTRAAFDANVKAHDKIMRQVKAISSYSRYEDLLVSDIPTPSADALSGAAKAISEMPEPSFEKMIDILESASDEVGGINQVSSFVEVIRNCEKGGKDVLTTQKAIAENLGRVADGIRSKTIDKVEREREKRRVSSDLTVKRWDGLREFVLKSPTLNSDDDIPGDLSCIYIKVPKLDGDEASYKYLGTPDDSSPWGMGYRNIRKYEFFDGFSSGAAKRVCGGEASLSHITGNPVIRKHFEDRGFATAWESGQWMMTPVVFTNIYRAAVSEQACEALLTDAGFICEPLPKGLEEKFDFIITDRRTGNKALVDVKFWRMSRMLKDGTADKIEKVSGITGINHVIYMNMLDFDGNGDIYHTNKFGKITGTKDDNVMIIPGLMYDHSPEVIPGRMKRIRNFINN